MIAHARQWSLLLCVGFALVGVAACASDDAPADGSSDASNASGQALGDPTAVFPEDFGAIQTVRELDDGTVLVADPLGGTLYRVDMDAGSREQVGATGQGPEEYLQPDAVWPLPGDSTLLVDLGNGRMTALGPDLAFGDTSPLSAGDPRSGMVIALPQGVDRDGRVYTRSIAMSMGGDTGPPDSGAVLRVERGSFAIDTVAWVKLEDRIVETSGGPDNQNVSVSPVFLSLEDTWGVAPDGSLVVARSGDYSVEWHRPDGTVTRGAPTPFEVVPIGRPVQEEFLRARSANGGGLSISVMMGNEGMQMSFGRGGAGVTDDDENVDDYTWPDTKPPFYAQRIPVDPAGRAWIQRHVEAGEASTYDVFDGSGARVATYLLPHGERVVGFGDGSLYVVWADEFDLNYLRRYALPG